MAIKSNSPTRTAPEGKVDKRMSIILAASDLFVEHGVSSTSMDAIARQAGVSKPTIYAYFDGKEAIFAAVVSEALPEGLRTFVHEPTGDVRADLIRYATELMDLLADPETVACDRMIAAESARHPELGRIFYEAAPGRIVRNLTAYFESIRAAGLLDIDDPEEAAEFFGGIIIGSTPWKNLLGGLNPPYRPSDERLRNAVERFLKAFAKS
jgi:AcrR family transcriptional regulator